MSKRSVKKSPEKLSFKERVKLGQENKNTINVESTDLLEEDLVVEEHVHGTSCSH